MITLSPGNQDRTYAGNPINSSTVTNIDHALRHLGKSYMASEKLQVSGSSNYYFYFKTGTSKEIHLWNYLFISTQANAEIVLFEGSTITVNGTAVILQNENRFAPNSLDMVLYRGSTVSVEGTQLGHMLISGKKGEGGSAVGDEIILRDNTAYIIKYINNSASADDISFDFVFLDIK